MKPTATAVVLMLGLAGPALAQPYPYDHPPPPHGRIAQMNHDFQRLWDDTFNPRRDGDRGRWEHRRDEQRREWCRYHADYGRCGYYR